MKVFHTISALDVFGPEKTVINECLALRDAGWDCRILNFWDNPDVPISAKIKASGVPYECIPSKAKFDIGAIRLLARRLREEGRPLVHSHGYKADLYTLLAARLAHAPVVTTVHGWTSENRKVRLYESLQAFLWRFFDRVICVSESYRAIAERSGTPAKKLVVIHNGIRASYRPGDSAVRRRIRAEFDLGDDQVAVAIIGRLGIEKGHRLFVDAAARLLPAYPGARFFIVGEGAERTTISAQITSLGIGEQVRLLGHRDDLPSIYQGLDLLAITSLREGLPNVLLEAMLNGVPAVAMSVGGIPEVIRDGQDGLLVTPGDLAQFTDRLGRLLGDAHERRRHGEAARATVQDRFLFERRMEQVIELYGSTQAAIAARRQASAG
jgi:glycosyltransferase involved in cell wall biosynthesis